MCFFPPLTLVLCDSGRDNQHAQKSKNLWSPTPSLPCWPQKEIFMAFLAGFHLRLPENKTCREKREKMEMEKMEMSKVQLLSSKLIRSEVSSDALRSSMLLFWGKLVDSCVFIWTGKLRLPPNHPRSSRTLLLHSNWHSMAGTLWHGGAGCHGSHGISNSGSTKLTKSWSDLVILVRVLTWFENIKSPENVEMSNHAGQGWS